MPLSSVFFVFVSAVVAIALAFFHYFYRAKNKHSYHFLLASLRAVSIFLILVLFINPEIRSTQYRTEKPSLLLAVDNSASIDYLGSSKVVSEFVNDIQNDQDIKDRFDVEVFAFGEQVERTSDFSFSDTQTNIFDAFNSLKELFPEGPAPIVLITDGNQTYGRDYLTGARGLKYPVYPVVVGDTTKYPDLSLSRVNVNKLSLLNNDFPVEVFLNYTGEEAIESELQISQNNRVLFSKSLSLDKARNSVVVETHLPASKVGVSTYEVEVLPLSEERNTYNNLTSFAMEVIDERSSVLILTEVIHPDLGALKRSIESNEQREVVVRQINDPLEDLEEFDLVILYQPTEKFVTVVQEMEKKSRNYWLISGPETNWDFVNGIQDNFKKLRTNQFEDYFSELNPDFQPFQIDDIGFSNFPPLTDVFGEIESNNSLETILYQKVQGLTTQTPLLATTSSGNSRYGFLFGANIWQWRGQVFLQTGSFENFDQFVGKLVQYLSSGQNKERLFLNYENLYSANETVKISADYFDENFSFDPRAELTLELEPLDGEVQTLPFSLNGNKYEVNLNELMPSEYSFTVRVEGEHLSRSGQFAVAEHTIEKYFYSANSNGLRSLAEITGGALFGPNDSERLRKKLLGDNSYLPVQKSHQKNVSLVDWYYLLAFALFSLSIEWFIRKYHGLI